MEEYGGLAVVEKDPYQGRAMKNFKCEALATFLFCCIILTRFYAIIEMIPNNNNKLSFNKSNLWIITTVNSG